ncbi:sugar transferase [Cohnella sp. GCM10027633]|uniref:sugar transferase n=1 Tax=unclassified Cohnella TaxID=2636738 RepID=UPI00363F1D7F
MKRLFDVIISFIALIAFSPLFIVIGLMIKLDSKGPVFFRQQRSGKGNMLFTIYKFRTMRIDSPNLPTHLLASPEAYITRVGRILRKTSLDELPQLLNIINGDMSIVGPRPALYNQVELIHMRNEMNIQQLRPGLTGWAQVNGRDEITDEQKAQYDLYYLQNQGLFMDIKIIVRTVTNVVQSKGIKA